MKETPLTQAFEDALRKIDSDPAQHHMAEQLAVLQHTVIDFRDAGIDVTLNVRPQARGFALELEDEAYNKPLANGEIICGDIRLDFIIQREGYYQDEMKLKFYRDAELLLERTSHLDEEKQTWSDTPPETEEDSDGGYDDEDETEKDIWDDEAEDEDSDEETAEAETPAQASDLKSVVTRLLVDLKAQQDYAAQFNVGPNGIAGSAVEKPFSVAAPLKLKKPGSP